MMDDQAMCPVEHHEAENAADGGLVRVRVCHQKEICQTEGGRVRAIHAQVCAGEPSYHLAMCIIFDGVRGMRKALKDAAGGEAEPLLHAPGGDPPDPPSPPDRRAHTGGNELAKTAHAAKAFVHRAPREQREVPAPEFVPKSLVDCSLQETGGRASLAAC